MADNITNPSEFVNEKVALHFNDPQPLSPECTREKKLEAWHEKRTKIPPGRYSLLCFKAGRGKPWQQGQSGWGRSEKVILWFEIIEGHFAGAVVPAFLPLEKENRIPQGSKYFQFWCIANGLKRPTRNRLKEMPPSKFVGKVFEGDVLDVKPRWINGKEQPEFFFYSRVDAVYELLIGDPSK